MIIICQEQDDCDNPELNDPLTGALYPLKTKCMKYGDPV